MHRRRDDQSKPASEQALTRQLKEAGRRRRKALKDLSAPAGTRPLRNDPLPNLESVYLPLDQVRIAARKPRKAEAAHIREVAASIGALGFSARS
jgi:hypothetical protein